MSCYSASPAVTNTVTQLAEKKGDPDNNVSSTSHVVTTPGTQSGGNPAGNDTGRIPQRAEHREVSS